MTDHTQKHYNPETQVSKTIQAPREAVYNAFLDPKLLTLWLAPDNMECHIHFHESREGGTFRISLKYKASEAAAGKSDEDTDTYHGRFAELVPYEKIVEVIEFETQDPGFAGEMTIIVHLAEMEEGTHLTVDFENMPRGIRPEDNTAGWHMSLQKLADLLE